MPGPGLVVFDCDGVLVDSERLAVPATAALLTRLGWSIGPDEVVDRFLGRPDAAVQAALEAALGRPVPDWPQLHHHCLLEAFDAGELRPVAGAADALDLLASAGIPTCVASSGTQQKLSATLALTGLADRVAGRVFSVTDVRRGKPAPDLFLHAAAAMGVPPRDCVVVEDSPVGVAAAIAAGMSVLGYAGGMTPAVALADAGATTFADLHRLGDLLGIGRDAARRETGGRRGRAGAGGA